MRNKNDMAEPDDLQLSAIDAYLNRVYRIIVIIIPLVCVCMSLIITGLHAVGWYDEVDGRAMWIFDSWTLLFLIVGIWFFATGFDQKGILKKEKLKNAKIAMLVFLLIQWNAISYICPFSNFWAYSALFTVMLAFFFDARYVAVASVCLLFSEFASWIVLGGRLLPAHDAYFGANMVFRLMGIVLTIGAVNLFTFFGEKYLVEELEKSANYDTLTRLLNRRSMDNHLQSAYHQAETGEAPFCLIMTDLDDFKNINDTYGHDCGDEVLKFVAHTLITGVKKNDYVFRWGGEEFCIIIKANEREAVAAAERIRKDIAKDPINYRNEVRVSITVTMGGSAYHDGVTIREMMDEADLKLYWGKRHGKNRVVSSLPKDSENPGTKKEGEKPSETNP